jgi:tetratricopeptide (TPR) repeat protein
MSNHLIWRRKPPVVKLESPFVVFAFLIISLLWFFSCESNKKSIIAENLDYGITICGTVQFMGNCASETDSLVPLGIALVHHMTYEEAEEIFDQVIKTDPSCFWGPWGKAMTYIHPLWNDQPSEDQMNTGWKLSQKCKDLASNPREDQYAEVIASYYRDGHNKTLQERLKNWNMAWEAAFDEFPQDLEIKSFYALSLIAVADPTDKDYPNQLQAGNLAQEVLQEIPSHPGAFHYTIHAYDYPELADKAKIAADNYSSIAPDVPHALHMPSHIFTRLGLWEESIEWNRRSAEAAKKSTLGSGSLHYLHAKDYIVYALLQQLKDEEVKQELEDINKIRSNAEQHPAAAYALAAVEARFSLERQNWQYAAQIAPRNGEAIDWDRFPEYEALSHFAIGLGSARSGDIIKAQNASNTLQTLSEKIKNPYWSEQVKVQSLTVKAWAEFAKGNKTKALELMKESEIKERATNKHPITPGELLPASELLGDLYLELNNPEKALIHYEYALERSPERFNSLRGAAISAEMINNLDVAQKYKNKLSNLTKGAQIPVPKWGVTLN